MLASNYCTSVIETDSFSSQWASAFVCYVFYNICKVSERLCLFVKSSKSAAIVVRCHIYSSPFALTAIWESMHGSKIFIDEFPMLIVFIAIKPIKSIINTLSTTYPSQSNYNFTNSILLCNYLPLHHPSPFDCDSAIYFPNWQSNIQS